MLFCQEKNALKLIFIIKNISAFLNHIYYAKIITKKVSFKQKKIIPHTLRMRYKILRSNLGF